MTPAQPGQSFRAYPATLPYTQAPVRTPARPKLRTYTELGSLAEAWEELALGAGSPFMTHAWLTAWWRSFGHGDPIWIVLEDGEGSLSAGAFMLRSGGVLSAAANVHSGDWSTLARNEDARAELWSAITKLGAGRIHLQGMQADARSTQAACRELASGGYSVASQPGPFCPWLELPSSFDQLMADVSPSLRSQVRRRRRGLEKQGTVEFRTVAGGPTLEEDLETFLRLEASGWKAGTGTAILSSPSTERLYREFAGEAAAKGWLRLYILELNGEAIAADYGCAYEGRGVFLKTGFDEAHARLSPGLVLRAETLRSSIEEGLIHYDFLGDADTYKTRWTSEVHPRTRIFGYRGVARPGYLYRRSVRPVLRSVHDRVTARSNARQTHS